jgi:indolepyruvate ferredoxin oxidoreductase
MAFGPWMMKAFGLLRHGKRLRGTAFDPFGYTAERRDERARIGRYRAVIEGLLPKLARENIALGAEIAALQERVRGFGHVRARNAAEIDRLEAELLARFAKPGDQIVRAAAE